MPETDLGTVVQHIQLDASQLESAVNMVLEKLQQIGEQAVITAGKFNNITASMNVFSQDANSATQSFSSAAQELENLGTIALKESKLIGQASEQHADFNKQVKDKSVIETKEGLDALAGGLNTVASAAGGTAGSYLQFASSAVSSIAAITAAETAASAASGWIGLVATLISGAIGLIGQAEKERQQNFEEGVENYKKYGEQLTALQTSFDVLNNQASTTEQLATARNNIASSAPELVVGYTKEGDAILANNEAIQQYIENQKTAKQISRDEIINNKGSVGDEYKKKAEEIKQYQEQIKQYQNTIDSYNSTPSDKVTDEMLTNYNDATLNIENTKKQLRDAEKDQFNGYGDAVNYFDAQIESLVKVQDATSGVNKGFDDLDNKQQAVAKDYELKMQKSLLNGSKSYEDVVKEINNLLSDSSGVDQYYNKLISQQQSAKTAAEEQAEATQAAAQAQQQWKNQMSTLDNLSGAYDTLSQGRNLEISQVYDLCQKYPEIASYIAETGDLTLQNGAIVAQTFEEKRKIFLAEQQQKVDELQGEHDKTQSLVDECAARIEALRAVAVSSGTMSASDMAYNSKEYNEAQAKLNQVDQKLAAAKVSLEALKNSSLPTNTGSTKSSSSGSTRNEALSDELKQIEQKKKLNELSSQEELDWLQRIQSKYRMNADEKSDMEYRIYSAKKKLEEEQEKAASDALKAEYKDMENKKSLGELNSRDELAWLLRIRDQNRMNADERTELEIKIYNLKKSLNEADVKSLNDLGSAVTEALKNQYEQQKDAEKQHIQDSIDSWSKWEESTVASIQGQIDALDELEKEQDSSEKRAEYERKRQALEMQAAYEKDAYQQKQIQIELNQLNTDEQKRLDQEARDAQRKQLEDQIKQVQNTSKEQQDNLKKQQDELDKNYESMTSEMNLRAQAEKVIMSKTQGELVDLIKSYAPEYDIAGKTLGDQLVNGFQSRVQDIAGYVQDVIDNITNYQNAMASVANKAADDFWSSRTTYEQQINASAAPAIINISMPVNFNQPVESPVETKRAMDEVAAELAKIIQKGG